MAVAHVQSANDNHGGFEAVSVTFGGNVTAGNAIAVWVFLFNTTATFVSCTDTLSNTYTQVDTLAGSSGKGFTLYAKNITGGACTVTFAASSDAFSAWIAVSEISGADTTAPIDANNITANENPGTGTDAVTSGTDTTTVNGCLIWGATGEAGFGSVITVGTGFTSRTTGENHGQTLETLVQSSAGSIAATFTTNTGGADYVTAMLAFKPAGGGGRTTKNTRTDHLGMHIGMNWRGVW